jgi:hypothetical protein
MHVQASTGANRGIAAIFSALSSSETAALIAAFCPESLACGARRGGAGVSDQFTGLGCS